MADLDLTDAFAPEFLEEFTVIRRTEVVTAHGRSAPTPVPIQAVGVIGPTSPDDLQRLPEGDYMDKAITIDTQFRLQGPSTGYKADQILWHGSHFVVRVVDDYSQYGTGFVHAIAASIDAMDAPPQGTA